MALQDTASVEWYPQLFTRDLASTVDHFISATGFTRVADSGTADRSSVLLRQGEVRLVITAEQQATEGA